MTRGSLALCNFLVALLSLGCSSEGSTLLRRQAALIDHTLSDAAGEARVIVNLRVPEHSYGVDERDVAAVVHRLASKRIAGFEIDRRYQFVPAVAGRATPAAIERLAADEDVTFVQQDHQGGGHLKEAVPAIGGDVVQDTLGITGRGVLVAVLDTGVDTDHPDLRDALVAQHCFTQRACASFASEGSSAEDDNGHGSNVAGIIASRGVVSSRGFAPESKLVAVKINDANDSGQESDWVAGMDWVYANLATTPVKVVNLSFGTTAMYDGGASQCDRLHPALARAIDNLVQAGVAVFVATGNRGSSSSMPAPACNSDVIAVGAVYDSSAGRQPPQSVGATYQARWGSAFASCSDATSSLDTIACFTNSSDKMDLVAPGAPIVSDSLRGRTEMFWGTSQASPAAAGVAALMYQCNPELTSKVVKEAMRSTGATVTDKRNGLTFPSLRALAAVQEVCGEQTAPTTTDAGDAQTADSGAPTRGSDASRDAEPEEEGEDEAQGEDEEEEEEQAAAEQTRRDASTRPGTSGGNGASRTDDDREGCQLSHAHAGDALALLLLALLRRRARRAPR